MALTPQLPHMTPALVPAVPAALTGFTALVAHAGVRGFQRRVLI